MDKDIRRPHGILISDIENFKQQWSKRWMSAYKIQNRWKKHLLSIRKQKEDYLDQIKHNYCHQLELLFFAMDRWEINSDDCIRIPLFLFEVPKMRQLILEISIKESLKFCIIPGVNSIYRESYINKYVANNELVNINSFRRYGVNGPYCPKVIFISRPTSFRRRILNEQRLIDFLRIHIPEMEVYTFDSESSAILQAKTFSGCRVLIGLHGAGLANLLWMTRGYVYEITPKGHFFHDYDKKSINRGLTHRYLEVEKYVESEKCLVYPRDTILTITDQEMNSMLDILVEDGISKKSCSVVNNYRNRVLNSRIITTEILEDEKVSDIREQLSRHTSV